MQWCLVATDGDVIVWVGAGGRGRAWVRVRAGGCSCAHGGWVVVSSRVSNSRTAEQDNKLRHSPATLTLVVLQCRNADTSQAWVIHRYCGPPAARDIAAVAIAAGKCSWKYWLMTAPDVLPLRLSVYLQVTGRCRVVVVVERGGRGVGVILVVWWWCGGVVVWW